MTVIAVLASPPREGLVLPALSETSPLSAAAVTDLYEAMLADTFQAIDRSGAELLVNYPDSEQLPDAHRTDTEPVAELRAIVADALDDPSDVRFEPQVGSTFSARAGNTVTHLLREEEAASAAIIRGTAPLLSRTMIDGAAMKLRTNDVVVGPASEGRVYYAGFTEVIDFAMSSAQSSSSASLIGRPTPSCQPSSWVPRRSSKPAGISGHWCQNCAPGCRPNGSSPSEQRRSSTSMGSLLLRATTGANSSPSSNRYQFYRRHEQNRTLRAHPKRSAVERVAGFRQTPPARNGLYEHSLSPARQVFDAALISELV